MKPLDAYIRVSRKGSRSGESYITKKVQLERIERYVAARDFEIGEVFEDEDQSGASLDRPALELALGRIEAGTSGGLVVSKIDRFARSLVGALQVIERIQNAGGVILSAEGDLDTSTSNGRMVARLMLGLAEWELERIGDTWASSRSHAVARGVHVSSRVPTGYLKRDDGRLEPDPEVAPGIRELFERRTHGDGWTELARWLSSSASGVGRGPYENETWTASAVGKIVANPVYYGQARSGEFTNDEAHEAIVSKATWEAAQGARPGPSPQKNGGLLLAGLVRCSGCRYLMKPDSMKGRDGERLGLYRCRKVHASGHCPAPASILARVLDPWFEAQFLAALDDGGPMAEASQATDAVDAAVQNLADAEFELSAYLGSTLLRTVGQAAFEAGAESRQAAVDEARAELTEARRATAFSETLQTPGGLIAAWPGLVLEDRRHLLAAAVDAVMVRPARVNGTANLPVDERALVLWRGQAPDDLPRRGRRLPLSSFPWPNNERPAKARLAAA